LFGDELLFINVLSILLTDLVSKLRVKLFENDVYLLVLSVFHRVKL